MAEDLRRAIAERVRADVERCATRRAISGTRCDTPPTHKVTAGCVHEHITEGWACDRHVLQFSVGVINCADCYRGAESHVCQLLARVEPIKLAKEAERA